MPKNPEQDINEGQNEGEGSKTAAREYNQKATDHARSGHVDKEARDARDAVERDGDELRRAEEIGKSKAAEEDPELHKR